MRLAGPADVWEHGMRWGGRWGAALAGYGVLALAGCPAGSISRIAEETGKALGVPDQRRALETACFTVVGSDTAAFRTLLASDIARWGGLIRRLGLKPER